VAATKRALAELKGRAAPIPNQGILIDSRALLLAGTSAPSPPRRSPLWWLAGSFGWADPFASFNNARSVGPRLLSAQSWLCPRAQGAAALPSSWAQCPLQIRPYEPSDWPALWALLEPLFRAGETFSHDPVITEEQARVLWEEQT
jgi:hypothetical protein